VLGARCPAEVQYDLNPFLSAAGRNEEPARYCDKPKARPGMAFLPFLPLDCPADNQEDHQPNDQEKNEQDLGDPGGGSRYTGETQSSRH
jgi:hypothetical protein